MLPIKPEELKNLEEKVRGALEHYSPFRVDQEVKTALHLLSRLKKHHPKTYVESLQVGLTAEEIMRAAINTLKIPEALAITPHLPRTGTYGGPLHDIGKVGIPKEILDKAYSRTEEYTPKDHEIMKSHPQIGYEILMNHGLLMSAWIALLHHRRNLDDPYPLEIPPYPKELSKDTISHIEFSTRVVSVADQYISLHRSNRMHGNKPLSPKQIKAKLIEGNPDQAGLIEKLYKNHILF